MVLDMKRYILKCDDKEYDLTKTELKMLGLLSDNYFHSTKELRKFTGVWSICRLLAILKEKVPEIKIVSKKIYGYILINKIEIGE